MTTPQHAIDAAKVLEGLEYCMDWKNQKPDAVRFATAMADARQFVIDARHPDPELARLREENESLKTLWTDMRVVLTQSRNANCLASYGAAQADAVEAANRILNVMPKDVTTERENLRIERDALHSSVMPLLAERDQLRARVADLEKDRERAENHLRGVLETTSAERERDRIDAERFRMLSSRCEELDDNPEGYYFALPIDGKSSDVFERFTAAIDAARAPKQPVEAGLPEGYVIVCDAAASVYHWELGDKQGWDFPTRQYAVESAWKHHNFK